MKHEGWSEIQRSLGVDLDPRQLDQLDAYAELLETRGAALGLVAAADLPRLRDRHLVDGLRGVPLLPPGRAAVVDLGSGSGIPGVLLAIARPDLDVVLTEVRRSRAAFLELVIDQLGLTDAHVHAGRAEDLDRRFDVCVARAFAPAAEAWAVALGLLVPGGSLLYWAGERFDPERDAPDNVRIRVPTVDALANGGPVVIMSAR